MPRLIERLGAAVKAFTMTWSAGWGSRWTHWGGGARVDYAATVSNGRGSTIVMAVLGWMGRKFPEAPVALRRKLADGNKEEITTHPLLTLLRKPNDYYSGAQLLVAAVLDWMLYGNGYLVKVRSKAGNRVANLWYVPQHLIWPHWPDDETFIDYYVYRGATCDEHQEPKDRRHF